MLIRVAHIVKETFTNQAGNVFYLHLKEVLKKGESIEVSFKDTSAPSSSFLNSSFGALIEEIGLQEFLSLVKPRELTPTQAQMLRHYIQGFKSDSREH
ncbi:STAS-like domain-containing protein [Belliella sp. R4-6]|uniref:STAS-like domain-containing protein n=1 Tax=Belliella alkalica TaxID=1730871 RepID=A0ABS9VFN1_9BACT|nr:STAS-like domain-containing protein [Belliella alkalica]MCH7415247.1 STAS-like domain-containing protein [Belliella alkalica]